MQDKQLLRARHQHNQAATSGKNLQITITGTALQNVHSNDSPYYSVQASASNEGLTMSICMIPGLIFQLRKLFFPKLKAQQL